jgi:hypothetical protein
LAVAVHLLVVLKGSIAVLMARSLGTDRKGFDIQRPQGNPKRKKFRRKFRGKLRDDVTGALHLWGFILDLPSLAHAERHHSVQAGLGTGPRTKKHRESIAWGRVFRDEFHEEKRQHTVCMNSCKSSQPVCGFHAKGCLGPILAL